MEDTKVIFVARANTIGNIWALIIGVNFLACHGCGPFNIEISLHFRGVHKQIILSN